MEDITKNIQLSDNDLEKLKTHFPHYFDKDGYFQIDKFKNNLITKEINLTSESYSLEWLGKSYARVLANQASTTLIKADVLHNQKDVNKNSHNLLIKGDNLEVLKHLVNAYQDSIKMIYIDPPYNTRGDGFVYQDDRKFSIQELQQLAGIDAEKAKRILDFTQSKSNSHSAWLTFMYPRLYIARYLLSDDGVIFISIDDNELAQLRLLMDEIYGEENFVGTLSVENNPKGRKNSDFISVNSEFLIIYAKKKSDAYFIENIPKNAADMSEDENGDLVHNSGKRVLVGENKFNNIVIDEQSEKNYSVYYNKKLNQLKLVQEKFGNHDQQLIAKGYTKYYSYNENQLVENTYTREKFQSLYDSGALEFTNDKIFEKNFNERIRIKSLLVNKKYKAIINGKKQDFSLDLTTTGAGTRLKKLFNAEDLYFNAPKNTGYLKILISLFADKDFTILDFFAGSGSTGDAVMQLNAEDGGTRRYILVQLDEPIQIDKNKPAYDFLKNNLQSDNPNIFDITKERLIRAANTINHENLEYRGDLGFKVFETVPIWDDYHFDADELNAQQVLFSSLKLTPSDIQSLLITWKTYDGIPLTKDFSIVDLGEYTAYYSNGLLYLMDINFTTKHLKNLLERIDTDNDFNPTNIIIFGYHFESKSLREITENVKSYVNKKKSDIDVSIRY